MMGLLICCARPSQWFSGCGHTTGGLRLTAACGGLCTPSFSCLDWQWPITGGQCCLLLVWVYQSGVLEGRKEFSLTIWNNS